MATQLEKLSQDSIDFLAKSLEFSNGIKNSHIKGYKGWKCIVMMILQWEKEKIQDENETIFQLKNKLSQLLLSHKQDLNAEDKSIIENALELLLTA